MAPESTRKFNTLIGTLFILGGLAGWGVAMYKSVVPAPSVVFEAAPAPLVDARSCATILKEIGFEATASAGEVKAYLTGSAEVLEGTSAKSPKDLLGDATLAVSACKMKLKTFCMGNAEGCPGEPGLTMVLHNESAVPVSDPRSKAAQGKDRVLPAKAKG